MDDIAAMTGEGNFRRPTRYSEVTFNGSKGEFYFRSKDAKRDENTGKYPKEKLGAELSVVFLKVRRLLQAKYVPNKPSLRTNEHNHKNERVVLFEGKTRVKSGIAADLREENKGLYTNQIVYAYLPGAKGREGKVVRLIIKGASLGSEKTAKGVKKFYDYLQSFEGDEHFYNFVTKLVPVPEEGPGGTYYAIDFQRGEALPEERQEKVMGLIKDTHADITRSDEAFRASSLKPGDLAADAALPEEEEDEEEGIKYPDEEINPEDIPF